MTTHRTDTVQEIDALIDKADKRFDEWEAKQSPDGMQAERDHVYDLQEARARIVGKTWLEAFDDDYDGYSPSHDEHPEPKPTRTPFPLAMLVCVITGTLIGMTIWQAFN